MSSASFSLPIKMIRLGDIAHISYGKGLPVKYLSGEGYPVFGANGVIGFHSEYMYAKPQVLISCRGAASGTINMSPKNCFITNNSLIVNFNDGETICSKAFFYLLQAANKKDLVTGSAQPQVTINNAVELKIPLFPYAVQKNIVAKIEELFSELDSGIASLKTAQEQLKIYRQALLKHAFEGKLTEQWRKDNANKLETPEQLLARIQTERETRYQQQLDEWKQAVKDWEVKGKEGKKPTKPNKIIKAEKLSESDLANVPSLPASWFWLKIGMLCDVVRGGSPRPAGDSRFYDGEIPFLKVADLTRVTGLYVNSAAYTIKPAGLQKTRAVSPNTLLISNSGATLGVPKICTIYATFNDGVAAFLRLGEAELKYHYYFWESKTAELRAINQGAAQPNLNTDLIKDTLFPSCSLAEQQEIVNQLEEKLSIIEQNEKEIEDALAKAELLRQSILKKAFSGQLVS